MKKSRYSDEQIVRILREADQSPVAEVVKQHGVSEQTVYAWQACSSRLLEKSCFKDQARDRKDQSGRHDQ